MSYLIVRISADINLKISLEMNMYKHCT